MDIPLWLKLIVAAPGLYYLFRFIRWLAQDARPGGYGDGGDGGFCDGGGDGGDCG